MKEVAIPVAVAAGTGFFAWLFGKLRTRRENKKSDLQLINEAIAPLLDSIGKLTEQNNEMVCRLLAEQDKNLKLIAEKSEWQQERCELIEKIDKLEKTVNSLNKRINEFIKKEQ